MVKTCPHCGTVLYTKIFASPIRQAIFDYIRTHPGCQIGDIMGATYANRRDGGPVSLNIISVFINKMKAPLAQHGLRIKVTKGIGAEYFLVPLEEAHYESI
jgi:hypothetical protein